MTEAERIDAFEQQCRKQRRYPESLTRALVDYLKGSGSLDQAREAWQQASQSKHHLYPAYFQFSESEQRLDALDLRALDLFSISDAPFPFLYTIAKQERVTIAFEYLLSQGMEEQQILEWALDIVAYAVESNNQVTALGRYLLAYLPEQTDKLLAALEKRENYYKYRRYASFVQLLLAAQPPSIDLAWQIAQRVQEGIGTQPAYYDYALGDIAGALLKADPTRFTGWVRELAGPSSPVHITARVRALQALFSHNQEQHIDLALEAARSPITGKTKYAYAQVQITGLQAVIKYDPVAYWPLLEDAAASPNYYLSSQAVKLLAGADFEQARPTLQHCVADGSTDSALRALEVLFNKSWDEQEDYLLSLLAHRSKQVRMRVSKWLVGRGQAMVEGIGPYLTHRSADARLAAVQTLGQIGGEQAKTLLADRLAPEKALRVKEAILDVVGGWEALWRVIGIPADRADLQGAEPHSPEAIQLEAEATLSYVPRPALAWFDVETAPAPRWKTGDPVPASVLRYLLYRQSRATNKHALNAQLAPALALIDHSTSGDLARALFRGWVNNGTASAEAWLLPLACALGDDRLAHSLRRKIDTWEEEGRRALATQGIQALAFIEGEAALDELHDLAKQFTRGSLAYLIKKAIAAAEKR